MALFQVITNPLQVRGGRRPAVRMVHGESRTDTLFPIFLNGSDNTENAKYVFLVPVLPWPQKHPGEVLLTALAQESLEGRLAESLPWLVLHHWGADSDWLVENAKKFDLQNRLGFLVSLACRLSDGSSLFLN